MSCHPELDSGSIHLIRKSTVIDSGSESGMTVKKCKKARHPEALAGGKYNRNVILSDSEGSLTRFERDSSVTTFPQNDCNVALDRDFSQTAFAQNDGKVRGKKAAFTLAEVLLTMTIVGVVAAMTIPTLSYQRVKKEYSVKLKNFYSRMENSILDMQMDYGSFRDIPKPKDKASAYDWYMKYIDPYMGHAYVDKNARRVYFKDGSSLTVYYAGDFAEYYYDLNGDKAPNKYGYDRHLFLFAFDDTRRLNCMGNTETFFGPYCPAGQSIVGVSREELINRCRNGGTASIGVWCTKLLQNDQWEFKSDYPLKF